MYAFCAYIYTHIDKLGLTGYDGWYGALARDLRWIWLTFDEQAHA